MLSPTVLLGRVTVLVVDDEEPLRHYIGRVMDEAGYEVLTAADGHEALLLLRRSRVPVQLVISDVCMPEMSGPELAARVAERPYPPPVLFVSGGHSYSGLPGPLLRKPFLPGALTTLARAMLSVDIEPEPQIAEMCHYFGLPTYPLTCLHALSG